MHSRVDQLILDLVDGLHRPTGRDLIDIRVHVAQAGFSPSRTLSVDSRVVGLRRADGTLVNANDKLPSAELHYLRHVERQEEWPRGTSQEQYQNSLADLAAGLRVGILLRQIAHFGWHLSIVGRSGGWKGRLGSDWMIVEYRVSDGHWVTGYQPRDGLMFANRRLRRRWLRLPS
jgi:hypothetical protein